MIDDEREEKCDLPEPELERLEKKKLNDNGVHVMKQWAGVCFFIAAVSDLSSLRFIAWRVNKFSH